MAAWLASLPEVYIAITEIEGVCLQGNAVDQVGEDGSTIFVPVMPELQDN